MTNAAIAPEARPRFGALHAHRFLLRIGLALAGAFAWIFIFQYFFLRQGTIAGALISAVLTYGLMQIVTMVLTPVAAAHLRRGVKQSIFFGTLLAAAAHIYLGAALSGVFSTGSTEQGIVLFAVLLGAYRALYFIPYQEAVSAGERGRLPLAYEAVIAFMPLFAGMSLVILPSAPLRLLLGAAASMALSLVPLLPARDTSERFSWHYVQTFREFFSGRATAIRVTSLMQGIQSMALFLAWPIAVFLIVGSDYAMLGAILSATLFLLVAARFLYRRMFSRTAVHSSTTVAVFSAASGWLIRLFVATPLGVVFADSYSHALSPKRAYHFDSSTLELSADSGSYIDEYTALKEIGLCIGRIAACAVFSIFLLSVSVPLALAGILLVAALSSAIGVIAERSGMHAF